MRVCVTFHNDIFTPWPATSIIHPVEVLIDAGHYLTVISWDKGKDDTIMEATLPVDRIRVKVPVRNSLSLYKFSKSLSAKIIELKPDLIFAFDLEVLLGSSYASRQLGVPLLYFAREDWPSMVRKEGGLRSVIRSYIFQKLERKIVSNYVDHAYSVNEERGRKFEDWGVPYSTIYTTRYLSELPPPLKKNERFSITVAGSLNEMNAIPTILKAIEEIDCDLYLIGGSKENVDAVKKIVESSNVKDRVIITGRLDSKEYYELISKCHIGLTLPYNTDPNQFYGITVKTWDYMAMGLPIVGSDFPVMKSIIQDQDIGVVVDPTSSDSVKRGILLVKKDMELKGERARKLFEAKYAWEKQRSILEQSHWIFKSNKKSIEH